LSGSGSEGIRARVRTIRACDFLVCAAIVLGSTGAAQVGSLSRLAWAGGVAAAACLAIRYAGGYRILTLTRASDALARVAVALGALAVASWLVAQLRIVPSQLPAALPFALALALPALLLARAAVCRLLRWRRVRHRILLIGSGHLASRVAHRLGLYEGLGIELAGLLVEDPHAPAAWAGSFPVLGGIEDAEKRIGEPFDCIVVACNQHDPAFPTDALLRAKLSGREVLSGTQLYEELTQSLYLDEASSTELAFSDGFRPPAFHAALHRAIEVTIAGAGLLLAAPVIAVVALAVKLDSPGPAFYSQARMGRHGRLFRLWKLRSMQPNAESGTGAVWTRGAADVRVTRVGRILRPTRIDELPQMWNVLVGDMSLVGPRPERPEFLAELQARYPYFQIRHVVRPGITGWAQTHLGYVNAFEDWEHKLAYDLFYVKHRSIWFDLKILLATPKTVFLLRGL
jgi:exopolysaccharide biosynthesis polyprenyl glycosylphosphotransferase